MTDLLASLLLLAIGYPIAHRRGVRFGRQWMEREILDNRRASPHQRTLAWAEGRDAARFIVPDPQERGPCPPDVTALDPVAAYWRGVDAGITAKTRAIQRLDEQAWAQRVVP